MQQLQRFNCLHTTTAALAAVVFVALSSFSQPALALLEDNEARKAKEQETEKTEDNTPILGGSRLMITAGPGGMGTSPSPAPYGQTNGFAPQPTGFGY